MMRPPSEPKPPSSRVRCAEISRYGGARERQCAMQSWRCGGAASVITSIMIVRTGSDRISECRTMSECDSISSDCAWPCDPRLLPLWYLLLCGYRMLDNLSLLSIHERSIASLLCDPPEPSSSSIIEMQNSSRLIDPTLLLITNNKCLDTHNLLLLPIFSQND